MGKIMRFFLNRSIKQTFILFMLVFLLLATGLSALTINLVENLQNEIIRSHTTSTDTNEYIVGDNLIIQTTPITYALPTPYSILYDVTQVIYSAAIPVIFFICTLLASLLFYKMKLKKPLTLLQQASVKISDNDLDFHLDYKNHDELGQLCDSFEIMRASLEENYKTMWRTMEERKRLNAAFSHDLRTPLTVLRGYTDYLSKYIPEHRIPEEKVLSSIHTMDEHITRLEHYVSGMSSLQKLEEMEPNPTETNLTEFIDTLESSAQILCNNTVSLDFQRTITHEYANEAECKTILLDTELAARIYENLLSNALRYAKSKITVLLQYEAGCLYFTVMDDGSGFTEAALSKAVEPFFHEETEPSEKIKSHFGLGLYICKLLCEKQGGSLSISNVAPSGGCVKVFIKSPLLSLTQQRKP